MPKYWIQYQFADFRKHTPIIKVIHIENCAELQNISRDKLDGPYSTYEDVFKKAEKIYPDVLIRKCDKCF